MFTQSWEDPDCDRAALRPAPGESLLAITSGGDNVLGLLLCDPARIVAVDLNPAQSYLLELKMAALRRLGHHELLQLLGIRQGAGAAALLRRLRGDLGAPARAFWDAHPAWFARGLLTQGVFERYHALLRTLLRGVIGRARLEKLFRLAPEQQREFFEREWNTRAWRIMVRIACSKSMLGRRLDPSWFADAELPSFGAHFAALVEHAIVALPAHGNYFLAQIFLGRYLDGTAMPDYLREEHFDTIRQRLDRIRIVTADIGVALRDLPARSIDCFALSNVFEYSPRELFDGALEQLVRAARPGARFALRNLLAPRRLAQHPAFVVDAAAGKRLRDADRGFIYSHFESARLAAASVVPGGTQAGATRTTVLERGAAA
jgi:S-adenosylmethionine-diacylglycerol 3-amino-3-carboxypropyl transferase